MSYLNCTYFESNFSSGVDFKVRPKVLIIDDDPIASLLVKKVFFELGANVFTAYHEEDVPRLIRENPIDIMVVDWKLCQIDAHILLHVLDPLIQQLNRTQCVKAMIYTSVPESQLQLPKLKSIEIVDFWQKPMVPSEITTRLLKKLGKRIGFYG